MVESINLLESQDTPLNIINESNIECDLRESELEDSSPSNLSQRPLKLLEKKSDSSENEE